MFVPKPRRLAESSEEDPTRRNRPPAHRPGGCGRGLLWRFFYLEIGIRAFAPCLAGKKTQSMLVQNSPYRFPTERAQTLLMLDVFLQLAKRPRSETQAKI